MYLDTLIQYISQNPLILAPCIGIIPALIWLWFWLKEDLHPEPVRLLTLSFFAGMFVVFIALPLQRMVYDMFVNQTVLFFAWASIEEVLKFIAAWIVAIHTKSDDEPVDAIIYMIVVALGFSSLENTFFLVDQLHGGNILSSVVTGNMRFLGASLVHIISSATVGISLALSFYKPRYIKILSLISGLILASVLHSFFNLSIMNGNNIVTVFCVVWVAIILLMLMFEKVKRIIS